MVKKYPVVIYFVFTVILSWLFWTIPILLSMGIYKNNTLESIFGYGVGAPILVSITLTALLSGRDGIKKLLSRCSLKGIHIKWYLASAFSLVVVSLITVLLHQLIFGNPGRIIQWYTFERYFFLLPIMMIFAVLEEVGWRGFALPQLRKTHNPLTSALILGFIWGVWHYPKLISEGMTNIGSFIVFQVFVVLFSIFISWIYENTNGNILLAILAHAAANTALYGINPEILPKIDYNKGAILFNIVLLLFIILLLIINGRDLKSRKRTANTYSQRI